MARKLIKDEGMYHVCEHCDEIIVGNAYHITSEEDGVALLDMIVCALCAAEAKSLRLHTQEITRDNIETASPGERVHRSRFCV